MDFPSIETVINVLSAKGYVIYDNPAIDWNLNIVGIRANVAKPDKFDDLLVVFHKFSGNWDARYYQITTDPSPSYLAKPINEKGTAVLKEGQYLGTHKLDIHKRGTSSAHKALCQNLGEVVVYRDKNLDGTLDMRPESEDAGYFGINIHRGPRNGKWDENNRNYSAGCQVFADDRKFDEFLLMCENAEQAFGNKFTYTLLNEQDFR